MNQYRKEVSDFIRFSETLAASRLSPDTVNRGGMPGCRFLREASGRSLSEPRPRTMRRSSACQLISLTSTPPSAGVRFYSGSREDFTPAPREARSIRRRLDPPPSGSRSSPLHRRGVGRSHRAPIPRRPGAVHATGRAPFEKPHDGASTSPGRTGCLSSTPWGRVARPKALDPEAASRGRHLETTDSPDLALAASSPPFCSVIALTENGNSARPRADARHRRLPGCSGFAPDRTARSSADTSIR